MKKFLKKLLALSGWELRRKKTFDSANGYLYEGVIEALTHSKKRGVNPSAIIDVGAASGEWTIASMNVWPEADYVLFEPLEERKQMLEKLSGKFPNIHFISSAAGKASGKIGFFVSKDLDGSGIAEESKEGNIREVTTESVDQAVLRLGLKGPFLLKLDTHGHEVPILEGADRVLQETSLVIIECYGFSIAPGSLLMWQMCEYMDKLGFRMVDLIDIMKRPSDKAFWQCDIFFIPKSSPTFNSNNFE